MNHRVIHIQGTGRAGALALGAAVVVVGGVLVVVGATILVGLGVVGAAAGAGIVAWRRLTGRGRPSTIEPLARGRPLDPGLEVFPEGEPEVRRLPPSA